MYNTVKNVALVVSGAILFFFVLFVVNQTAQLVALADRVSPAFGTAALWFLIGLYAALLLAAAAFFLRLPSPSCPPRQRRSRNSPATWTPSANAWPPTRG